VHPTSGKSKNFYQTKDNVIVVGLNRVGKKTIVQTVNQLDIIECPVYDTTHVIEIPIIRPMCIATRGTRIVTLSKYGELVIFSTILRGFKITVPAEKEIKCQVAIPIPWYQGLWVSENGGVISALYPDGLIRRIKINK